VGPSHERASPQAIRAQALRDARNAERGDFGDFGDGDSATARGGGGAPASAFAGPKADAREMASLVGQLERYAEAKTGGAFANRLSKPSSTEDDKTRADRFALGGSNGANRGAARSGESAPFFSKPSFGNRGLEKTTSAGNGSQPKASTNGTNRWGARKGTNATASTRNIVRPVQDGKLSYGGGGAADDDDENVIRDLRDRKSRDSDPTYQNSLVGGWDAGSSRWENSSVPDSDVRSVYSAALEDSFGVYALPDAPADEMARVDARAGAAAETLERHRAALERTVSKIARATRASDEAASLETDGMFTAGSTKTGVGVIDFFARDPVGAGPKGSLARSVNERAERGRKNAMGKMGKNAAEQKTKWLSPAPRRAAKAAAPPEEPSPIVRMLRSVFGCGCGGR
jgi:hypothetical protein